jgi:hypothetical protein
MYACQSIELLFNLFKNELSLSLMLIIYFVFNVETTVRHFNVFITSSTNDVSEIYSITPSSG